MQITAPSELTTILCRTRTDTASQSTAVAAWTADSQAWASAPGFVAGALLRSLDDQRVVVYLHYLPAADPVLDSLPPNSLAALTDSHRYRIVAFETPPSTASSPLVIAQGAHLTTLINIFETDPQRQQSLVDTWLTAGKPLTEHPGFVVAALHRSTDGTRMVNYAHWRSPADWQDVVRQHRQDFEQFRPLGLSDPHLYEVVHLVEAAG